MLTLLKKWSWQDNSRQVKEIFRLLFPLNKEEIILFLILSIFFFSYSIFLVINTRILDNLLFPVDLYFSFDNGIYYVQGFSDLARHPLIKFFTFPVLHIGNLLYSLFHDYRARTLFITVICNSGISLSILYSFRYLRSIILLRGYILYLIITFYTFTSMNLILCFTIESFTISLFLLSYTTFFYSYYIDTNKKVTFLSNLIFAISLGGVTISNFIKGIIYIFFTKEKINILLRKSIIIGLFFLIILSWVEYKHHIFTDIIDAYSSFSRTSNESNSLRNLAMSFFGIPILLPDIISIPFHDRLRIGFAAYNTWWQILFIIVLLTTLLISFFLNYKNRLVILICTLFSIDIFIHCILKYGINELYIYAGHWLFIIPPLLGWLYKSLDSKKQKALNALLSVLFIILIINNTYQMSVFFRLAQQLFPTS